MREPVDCFAPRRDDDARLARRQAAARRVIDGPNPS
jgi:hypothetical protein